MSVDPLIEPAEPGSGSAPDDRHSDPVLQAGANAALERWLRDHPEVGDELKETVRAHIHLQELVVVGVAYLALLGLRTQFLTTVAGESTPVALLQPAMLTAISAGLVLFGLVVLARTRSFTLSRSAGIVRRTRQTAAAVRVTQGLAYQKLRRHFGALWHMLLPWALGTAAPTGVDRAKRAAALHQAVRQLFPVP